MDKKSSLVMAVTFIAVAGWFLYTSLEPAMQGAPRDVLIGLKHSDTLGDYLTDENGKTLYINSEENDSKSLCQDSCAKSWPPFLSDGKDSEGVESETLKLLKLNVTRRNDGTYQYLLNDRPLYYYVGDTKVGDTKGNGKDEIWSVASRYYRPPTNTP